MTHMVSAHLLGFNTKNSANSYFKIAYIASETALKWENLRNIGKRLVHFILISRQSAAWFCTIWCNITILMKLGEDRFQCICFAKSRNLVLMVTNKWFAISQFWWSLVRLDFNATIWNFGQITEPQPRGNKFFCNLKVYETTQIQTLHWWNIWSVLKMPHCTNVLLREVKQTACGDHI